jgi:hypothetical protein
LGLGFQFINWKLSFKSLFSRVKLPAIDCRTTGNPGSTAGVFKFSRLNLSGVSGGDRMCHRLILINGSEKASEKFTIEHIYRHVISKSLDSAVRLNFENS